VAALFKKTTVAEGAPPPAAQDIGLLGLDTQYQGDVRFRGRLTVDGTVTGHISSPEGSGATLVVNQSAVVTGDIVADSVLISGKVTGNIKAKERVEIFSAGLLKGDVHTGDIMIEGGAEFQGFCHMLRDPPGTAQPAPAAGGEAANRFAGNGSADGPADATGKDGKRRPAAH
jgi:cytoskeletal protein CcmA (bactofilin family)